jgi:hypothetical protein
MTNAMFAETLDNCQHSKRLNPESGSYTVFSLLHKAMLCESLACSPFAAGGDRHQIEQYERVLNKQS